MATSQGKALIGYGSDFQRSTDGTTYNSIGAVIGITVPEMKCKDIDMTNLLSPSGWKEFRAGLRDPGEAKFTVLFYKSDYQTIFADFSQVGATNYSLTSITHYWRVVFSDQTNTTASHLDFQGYVNALSTGIEIDDLVQVQCGFHATGPVTFSLAN
jgi:Lambda phage tail tube protein, TTP